MGSVLESTDVKNKLEDLSGVVVKPGENPYNALIDMCNDEPVGPAVSFCRNPGGDGKRRGAGNHPRWRGGTSHPCRPTTSRAHPPGEQGYPGGRHASYSPWMGLRTAFERLGFELTPRTEAGSGTLRHSPPQAECAAEGEVPGQGLQGAGHRPVSTEARESGDRAGLQGPEILHDVLGSSSSSCA